MDYKAFLIQVIMRGGYVLADMEQRIDKLWLEGKITEQDREELLPMAAQYAQDQYQVDVVAKLADLEKRVYDLEHPIDQYEIWTPGKTTMKGEIVRFDVTGDGEYDLCQYDGGREYTALSIGKIDGWYMLNRELEKTHTITRDASGGYIVTPIEPEPVEEPATEPDYSSMTKAELLALCEERGITAYESWTKAEIIAALEGAE